MGENVAKAEFLNYLLFAKHSASFQESPVIIAQTQALGGPIILNSFDADFSADELAVWLSRLDEFLPLESVVLKDLVFGVLYSSELFVKMIRGKDFKYEKIASLYKAQLQENKKYLAEFNKRDRGRININAPAEVVTRFPPEPSGYLHIGHAKAAILNSIMAKNGRLIVRLDDTNPEKESIVYEDAIIEDLKLLNITDFTLSRSSDYFDEIFRYAEQMIKDGKAYVDNTEKEEMRRQRTEGIPSKNREISIEESLRIFRGMNEGCYRDYCLRAKVSVDNPNKAMRDPVIYRYTDKRHHRTGDKYSIYPTYDLVAPILDSIEGVTLALRSNEYHDRNPLYYWFIEALGLSNKPKIHDFSRLTFDNTVVSKRQMKFYVDNGFVEGWDDPRLCTLRGLRRQGMCMDALIEYIKLQGASQKSAVNSWDKIWAMNKKTIDPMSPRYSAVPFDGAVFCKLAGELHAEFTRTAKNKKNPELGEKTVYYGNEIFIAQEDANALLENEEFTLMGWGNAIVVGKMIENGAVKEMKLQLNLGGDFKATKNKINWVAAKGATMVKVFEYGNLQNNEDTDDLEKQFNKDSKKVEWWLAECAIKDAQPGSYLQFERIGFFFCDRSLEFNLIPFTKQKRTY